MRPLLHRLLLLHHMLHRRLEDVAPAQLKLPVVQLTVYLMGDSFALREGQILGVSVMVLSQARLAPPEEIYGILSEVLTQWILLNRLVPGQGKGIMLLMIMVQVEHIDMKYIRSEDLVLHSLISAAFHHQETTFLMPLFKAVHVREPFLPRHLPEDVKIRILNPISI
jgi:hypothetical protein